MATFKQYDTSKGKRWQVHAYLGINEQTGKPKKIMKQGFRTKKEAQLELARLKLDFEKGALTKKSQATFEEIYNEWIKYYESTVKESTFDKTERMFKGRILPSFGKMRIDKINVLCCQKAVNQWHKELQEFKTVMNYASLVFDYAIKNQLIDKNPMKLITVPKKNKTAAKEENFYTRQELTTFFELMEQEKTPQRFTLFRLLAFSGMRKGEALALTWNDIDFNASTISINKALSHGKKNRLIVQTPKTKKSIRTISMDTKTMEILKEWRLIQRKDGLILGFNTMAKDQIVFSNEENKHIEPCTITRWQTNFIKKHGLKKITVHGFRHTHCSLLFEAGASIKEVQDRLGHSDIKTTMDIYTHVSKEKQDETAQKFAQYVAF